MRYPIGYNVDAIRALVRRAMDLGYYEGVNLSLAYCDDCGHEELDGYKVQKINHYKSFKCTENTR